MMNIEELYQREITQSEIDHKTPTAGAMTGHIVANLQVFEQKVQQIKWYYVGSDKIAIQTYLQEVLLTTARLKDRLGETLLDELELVPSVSEEFSEYTMLKEDSKIKYYDNVAMLSILASDLQTNMMFITRAIKLAEKEDLDSLKKILIDILGFSKHEFRLLNAQVNKSVVELKADLTEDDD